MGEFLPRSDSGWERNWPIITKSEQPIKTLIIPHFYTTSPSPKIYYKLNKISKIPTPQLVEKFIAETFRRSTFSAKSLLLHIREVNFSVSIALYFILILLTGSNIPQLLASTFAYKQVVRSKYLCAYIVCISFRFKENPENLILSFIHTYWINHENHFFSSLGY